MKYQIHLPLFFFNSKQIIKLLAFYQNILFDDSKRKLSNLLRLPTIENVLKINQILARRRSLV